MNCGRVSAIDEESESRPNEHFIQCVENVKTEAVHQQAGEKADCHKYEQLSVVSKEERETKIGHIFSTAHLNDND